MFFTLSEKILVRTVHWKVPWGTTCGSSMASLLQKSPFVGVCVLEEVTYSVLEVMMVFVTHVRYWVGNFEKDIIRHLLIQLLNVSPEHSRTLWSVTIYLHSAPPTSWPDFLNTSTRHETQTTGKTETRTTSDVKITWMQECLWQGIRWLQV